MFLISVVHCFIFRRGMPSHTTKMVYWQSFACSLKKTVIDRNNHLVVCLRHTASKAGSAGNTPVSAGDVFSQTNIQRFKQKLSKRYKPGFVLKGFDGKNPKQAAVLIPFCLVHGEPACIFTLRTKSLSSHSGQVSFPGGMVSCTDSDRVHTAIRETEEEIGLDSRRIEIWGQLHPLPGRNMETSVTPVVGYCGEVDLSTLKVNEHEVACVFSTTIESLCKPENVKYTMFRSPRFGRYIMPIFDGGKYRVWGLSAIILHKTLTHLAPGLYTFPYKILGD